MGFAKKPNYEIRIASKDLFNILTKEYEIPSGAKSLNIRIPLVIKKSSKCIVESFLRGVIDGDGSISGGVKIASGSKLFLEDLKMLFSGLAIDSGGVIKDNKNTNTYSIRVNSKDSLRKIKMIYDSGYSYKRKKELIGKI